MKTSFLFGALLVAVAFTSCGPAAENREQMLISSKRFQDSIAASLKQSIDEAAQPGPNMPMAGAPANTAAATAPATPTAPAK